MNITVPKIFEKQNALPQRREIIKGLAVLALSRAEIAGMYPFGLALAATIPHASAYIAFLGLGAGLSGTGLSVLKYVAALLLYYICTYPEKARSDGAKAVLLGISLTAAGAVRILTSEFHLYSVLTLLTESAVAGGTFRLFRIAGEKSERGHLCEVIIFGGILNGLSGAVIPYLNINAAYFIAALAGMSICRSLDTASAVLCCALMGFTVNLNTADAVTSCGAFALSAVLSAALSETGRLGTAMGYLCGTTVSVLYRGSLNGIQAADILLPPVLFAALPEAVHTKAADILYSRLEEEEDGSEGINARIAKKLRSAARAVRVLADGVTLRAGSYSSESSAETADILRARVCAECPNYDDCQNRGAFFDNLRALGTTLDEDGCCDSGNMPSVLRKGCVRPERFLNEFKHVYELHKQDALYHGEALSERDIIARQYYEISRVISALAEETENCAAACGEEKPCRRVSVSVGQAAKPGQAVCGDTILHFEQGGKYYVILCDGMGSGENAMAESRLTARLFSELIKAGFNKETAVSMINSSLALKADKESFSTADILEINLESGAAEFMKIGSAPSFIKTKNGVEAIPSRALPIGILEKLEVGVERRDLKNGSVVLMVSDGIGEAGKGVLKNDWIKKLLASSRRSGDELCAQILSGARARMSFADDMTCAVIRIKGGAVH